MNAINAKRERKSHVWEPEPLDHYVEPVWCIERLLQVETFYGSIHDPCCGFGTIPDAASRAGIYGTGSDIVNRGWPHTVVQDFFDDQTLRTHIISNPPYSVAEKFALHALKLATQNVAIILPVARLNAAHWLQRTPLARIWLLTPRPSMPPGHVITAGQKPGGGRVDFCWLVFERDFAGAAKLRWLHRDGVER